MKKIKFILLLSFVPFILNAQPYSNKDKALIASRIDTLLQKYMQKSSLAEIGSSKQSLKVIREFKTLFTPDAIIFDDMNAEYVENATDYPYQLNNKSVGEYFDGLIEQFSQGIIVNNKNLSISYSNIDNGEVIAALERSVSGIKSTGKYSLVNEDTLSIKIAVQPDKTVKIAGITAIGSHIRVINDKDLDGVIDSQDDCPELKGKVSLTGCPDSDGDGIRDKDDECPEQIGSITNRGCPASTFAYRYVFSASTGIMFNQTKITSIQVQDLGYNDGTPESHVDLKNPDFTFGYNMVNAQLAYYFGKKKFKKNIGVSIGIAFTPWTSSYDLSGSEFFFKDNFQGDYRKIVTLELANEEVNFTLLNFPLMLRYKGKIGKLAIEGSLGPSYLLYTNAVKGLKARSDFEAILQFDENTQTYTKYEDVYNYDESDLILTEKEVNSNLFMDANHNSATLFKELDEFGLGNDKDNTTSDNISRRSGIAINAGLDFFYHIKSTIAIKAGLTGTLAPTLNSNGKDSPPIKGAGDPYYSIFGSKAKSSYTSFGLNVGLIFGI